MSWQLWRGEEAKAIARKAEIEALRETGEDILRAARAEVPFQDGDLLRSGRIERSRAKKPTVRIIFGGPAAPYAVKWHERPAQFRHGRKRRYLADPFNRHAWRGYRQHLLSRLRARFP